MKVIDKPSDGKLFTSSEPEFNENTYMGRFEEFRSVADPRKAFYTNN